MSWISIKIHQIHPKYDGDHESARCFDLSSIDEELSTNFRSTSGKFEFSHCLKVKSELCSLSSFYNLKQFFTEQELRCVILRVLK
jgi:hypothetical protein